MLRAMQSMQMIIKAIGKSIKSFIYIALLLCLFIFIYALMGMQFFAGKMDFPGEVTRETFDSFHKSLITIFQVLTMENWQIILFSTMR
jgi:hypothetical protein